MLDYGQSSGERVGRDPHKQTGGTNANALHSHRSYRTHLHDTNIRSHTQQTVSALYMAWEEQLLDEVRHYLSAAHEALDTGQSLLQAQFQALEQIATHVIRTLSSARRSEVEAYTPPTITMRQQQILVGLSQGHHPKGIAQALGISERTVRTHIRDVCSRLEVSGAFAAVQAAKTMQLIP